MRRRLNALLALAASALLLLVLATGYGAIPALGTALAPGGGVWASARDTGVTGTRSVLLDGMRAPAEVAFSADGVPTVRAGSDHDMFLVQGYLQASFRLGQLDLQRRVATGRLAELQGAGAVESDVFELQSGLLRTAEATWATIPADSPDGEALTGYSQGVNNRLAELRRDGGWPALFSLTGVYPRDWTPVDSLAIQGLLTQMLSYNMTPLDNAVLRDSLGAERADTWFPVIAVNAQRPYDPGPYQDLGVTPLDPRANANAVVPTGAAPAPQAVPEVLPVPAPTPAPTPGAGASAMAAGDLVSRFAQLPTAHVPTAPASNAWVANGKAVSGAKSLLAGDPHLPLSLPSIWYQVALSSPTFDATGASLVGLPGIVVGHNEHISWSLTNVQNQATFYYTEQTSPDRPGQYFWQGAWRDMTRVQYSIPVRGGADVPLTVDLTVHGPVMTEVGRTTSVYWTGNLPSRSMAAIIGVGKARDHAEFRDALRNWNSPALNFAYADDQGNIGITAAGYFPQVRAGEPWLPLPGTGESDIVGTIPFDALPEAYDPPGNVLASANQRPVTAAYPYYIGTSKNSFEDGYRAARIYDYLESRQGMTAQDFATLQNDVTDQLSTILVPRLLAALRDASLDASQRDALAVLSSWDNRMTESSAGASIWWTFLDSYVHTVFDPWWTAMKVPVEEDRPTLAVSTSQRALVEDLEHWTLHDPGNAAFSPPDAPAGDATSAMRAAFSTAVEQLRGRLGPTPSTWTWGQLHSRLVPAITGAGPLGYGPFPAGGDRMTVNAADGGLSSDFGPSWRMVVGWTGVGAASAQAILPGGPSENPVSPWYENLVPDWLAGRLRPMPGADDPTPTGPVWTLQPVQGPP